MLDQAAIASLNHLLNGAPWARQKLDPHAGKTALVVLPPLRLQLAVSRGGWIAETVTESFDVEIVLPAHSMLLAFQGGEALMREAVVSGAADFAEALGFVLRNLRWDVEEDLSHLIGDIAAHRIVDGGRRVIAWQQRAARNLAENVVEFLQHERPTLSTRGAIGEFVSAVDRLRDDLARLEKRIERLSARRFRRLQ